MGLIDTMIENIQSMEDVGLTEEAVEYIHEVLDNLHTLRTMEEQGGFWLPVANEETEE